MHRSAVATTASGPGTSPRLRVAMVTETYPPEINGVAGSVARVVAGLVARGHRMQLVRPRRDARDRAAVEGPLEEWLVPGLRIPQYPELRFGLPCTRTLRRLWSASPPDVVHIATEGPLGLSALRAARALGIPVCSDFRTNFHRYSAHYGLRLVEGGIAGYLRWFHNACDATFAPTDALRGELQTTGYNNVDVIGRGVDDDLFDPARRSDVLRRSWGASEHDTVALCLGRLAPEKNLHTAIDAVEAMRRIDPTVRLVMVGDGPLRRELGERCPDAIFAGMRTGTDLAEHCASADLMLFPSLTETFGNVATEAMASGLALVAYDYAAAGRIVRHGHDGLLAPFGQHDGFVDAAVSLAGRQDSIRALGRAARQTVRALSWGSVVAATEAAYHRLLDGVDERAGLSSRSA
jgi:glycosyltransferase involved in cell wall biosynthesis